MIEIDRADRIRALRLVGYQTAMMAALALSGWLIARWQVAASLLMGGGIGVVGSAWLALSAFRPSATRPAKEILASFYIGEVGRFLIVTALFVVSFKQLALLAEPRNALMFFLAFIASQVAIAVAPRLIKAPKR